jgi:hypothetical protein
VAVERSSEMGNGPGLVDSSPRTKSPSVWVEGMSVRDHHINAAGPPQFRCARACSYAASSAPAPSAPPGATAGRV